ncbi:NADP-dependent 3-hydroxy acid dehydrogenase YdfG [Nocardia tenerifensis]|uniref:NADP-dependent 3-hydroxy acid dehydrogenase YdfG n=1 Tax=Nocardia tenerifensis TaxID=228006 RepID=A0A318K4A7_9NOCA|nr:SDR family NAD(P)-dependent oxidoreductase [Nocardia tenerifensis]PXX57640.1 NADP-dependent 3-hydroxy acid dehydrogenase YdfG [Nocardia tenerifensis]
MSEHSGLLATKRGEANAFVVIGAGPGLGAAAARRFGREGHPVGLITRNTERLAAMATDLNSEGITTATAAADVTDAQALTAALDALRTRLGPIQAALFSPRPSLSWIKPVLDTGPSDIANALALNVVAAAAAVRAVLPDMLDQRNSTLLFTTGGAAVEPHRDRAVSAIAYAAESAYVRMLHDALVDQGVYAAQVTVVGPIGPGARHEPDEVAQHLWRLHIERDQPLLVLR